MGSLVAGSGGDAAPFPPEAGARRQRRGYGRAGALTTERSALARQTRRARGRLPPFAPDTSPLSPATSLFAPANYAAPSLSE